MFLMDTLIWNSWSKFLFVIFKFLVIHCDSIPTYRLHSHLHVILWKRNMDLKCNSLVLFWTKFWALLILFTYTFGWSYERETWISSVIWIFWSLKHIVDPRLSSSLAISGSPVNDKVDLKCKCLSVLEFRKIFRILHWFSNHQFGTLNSTFRKKT